MKFETPPAAEVDKEAEELDPIEASAAKAAASETGENRLTAAQVAEYWELEETAYLERMANLLENGAELEEAELKKIQEKASEALLMGSATLVVAAGIAIAALASFGTGGNAALGGTMGLMTGGVLAMPVSLMDAEGGFDKLGKPLGKALQKAKQFLWGTESDYAEAVDKD